MLNATRHQWHKQEDVCTAFPHLRTRMAAQVSMKASHLLISALVYEPLDYLEIFVDNLLAFTRNSTVIMLHLSSSTNYTEAEAKWTYLIYCYQNYHIGDNSRPSPSKSVHQLPSLLHTSFPRFSWNLFTSECAYWSGNDKGP